MAFDDIVKLWKDTHTYPKKMTMRQIILDCRERLCNGKLFDVLQYPFEQEDRGGYSGNGNNYIPLRERRPAVQYNIAKMITDQVSALTFSQAHAPSITIELGKDSDMQSPESTAKLSALQSTIEKIVDFLDFNETFAEAMKVGSVGSVALVLRRCEDDTPWIDILKTKFCTPIFDPKNPRKLKKLTYIYSRSANDLEMDGYEGEFKEGTTYWIKIVFDEKEETRYLPLSTADYDRVGVMIDGKKVDWVKDVERSGEHGFPFMNVVWVKNMPKRDTVDGDSIYTTVADNQIEISYLLSQIGRGLRYTMDPLLVYSEGELQSAMPAGYSPGMDDDSVTTKRLQRTPARAISVDKGGDAKLLEITGQGLIAAAAHVKLMRELSLEQIGGMKSDAEHENGAASGKALHYLHQAIVWLVEGCRGSYGSRAYLPFLMLILRALKEGIIEIPGVDIENIEPDLSHHLQWPEWINPLGMDLKATMDAINTAAGGSPVQPVQTLPLPILSHLAAAAFGLNDTSRISAMLMSERGDKPIVTPQDVAGAQVGLMNAQATAATQKPATTGDAE